jgi:hypothetical protein
MMARHLLLPAVDAKWTAIWRLLRRVQHRLSCIGDAPHRCDAELCRLSGLPSCCFSHFADRQK